MKVQRQGRGAGLVCSRNKKKLTQLEQSEREEKQIRREVIEHKVMQHLKD